METQRPLPSTTAEIVAQLAGRVAEMRGLLATLPTTELNRWVVLTAHDTPLSFTMSADGSITKPRNCRVETATRFNHATARHVARRTRDGTGRYGKALVLTEAFELMIEDAEKTRAMLADFVKE
jgi:hypothetical protein